MNKVLTILKSRKVIKAVVGLIAAVVFSYGYHVSPELQTALSGAVCELIECIE
ncbi:hypothetical protein WM008_01180 [Vibrio vulnificus]|uniref:hypothetical protein n=1 Tax=Vibrio vulnificus TaxID=672 RepID=UPI0030EBE830